MSERLQKVLARHGLGSRREIERWIAEGRITVNLKPAIVGAHYREGDRVAIDGKEVTSRLNVAVVPQVLMFHKHQGQAIGREAGREESDVEIESVVERLPAVRGSRWVPINPMHAGDGGLALFTNDGNLGYALTRRKRWIPTQFMVRVLQPGKDFVVPEIPLHVDFDDERIEFSSVVPVNELQEDERANVWYRVEMPRADRRSAVRALFESHNLKVSRLTQVAFGPIELPRDLPRGRHRALTAAQSLQLYELAQLQAPSFEPPPKRVETKPKRRPSPDRRKAPKRKQTVGRRR